MYRIILNVCVVNARRRDCHEVVVLQEYLDTDICIFDDYYGIELPAANTADSYDVHIKGACVRVNTADQLDLLVLMNIPPLPSSSIY